MCVLLRHIDFTIQNSIKENYGRLGQCDWTTQLIKLCLCFTLWWPSGLRESVCVCVWWGGKEGCKRCGGNNYAIGQDAMQADGAADADARLETEREREREIGRASCRERV